MNAFLPLGDALRRRAESWLAQDPDPQTRAELLALLAAAESDPTARIDLATRFRSDLSFGTAGLRAPLGAGSRRMNRVVVAHAAAGLAAHVRANHPDGLPLVVIGFDARHNSAVFAADTAEILAGAGLRPLLLPDVAPTPVLAYAARRLGAAAAVMVTASHNPAGDNGYKVYGAGGRQILPPEDVELAAHIATARETPATAIPRSVGVETASDAVIAEYVAAVAALAPARPGSGTARWVYTPLHGVGWETFRAAIRAAGHPEPIVVEAQRDPDPDFPTVDYPNPEEDGALDLAYEAARAADADLILAHDPDADRLAVAIPDGDGWRRLTGDEVGLLLGWRAARAAKGRKRAVLASTLVSSPALEAVAEEYGLAYRATLTGSKWLAAVPDLVYGYEEALGYLVAPDLVAEKDGISAGLAILALAADARRRGETLADALAAFEKRFGHIATSLVTLRFDDPDALAARMSTLRAHLPERIGDVKVKRVDDLREGVDGFPPADVLRFVLKGGSRVIVRPSGTEPKLKAYVDARGDDRASANARLAALVAGVRTLLEQT